MKTNSTPTGEDRGIRNAAVLQSAFRIPHSELLEGAVLAAAVAHEFLGRAAGDQFVQDGLLVFAIAVLPKLQKPHTSPT